VKLRPGIVISSWMDPRVEVRESPIHGLGLFARESFGSDEIVLIRGGIALSEAEIQGGKADPASLLLIEDDLYLGNPVGSGGTEDHLNHSCEPNLWMRDALTVVTRDVVEEDEELTLDYALRETDPGWSLFPCGCGSTLCRKKITGQDWRLSELQERYGEHFTPVLQSWISTQA
jgi:uncharacterized protein